MRRFAVNGSALLELIVALGLGAVLMLSTTQLLWRCAQQLWQQQQQLSLAQRQRLAMVPLERSLALAGYGGIAPAAYFSPEGHLTLRYRAQRDCLGQYVPSGVVRDVFFLRTGTLYCRGAGSNAAQPLVDGVAHWSAHLHPAALEYCLVLRDPAARSITATCDTPLPNSVRLHRRVTLRNCPESCDAT